MSEALSRIAVRLQLFDVVTRAREVLGDDETATIVRNVFDDEDATAGPEDPAVTERRCDAPTLGNVVDFDREPYDVENMHVVSEHGIFNADAGGTMYVILREDEQLGLCVGCDECKPVKPRISGRRWLFCSDECSMRFLDRVEAVVVRVNKS